MDSAVVRPHDPAKSSMLKRTISKCSMDEAVGFKKLSPPRYGGDAGAAVLLPRARGFADEPEASPVLGGDLGLFDGSPSPQHVLYGEPPATSGACESLTAPRLFATLVEYLQDVLAYYQRGMALSFGQLQQLLQSVPFACRQLQGIVQARLGLAWHLVGAFVEQLLAFICDEDIRDASVSEFAAFAQRCCGLGGDASELAFQSAGDIFARLGDFFRDVLDAFKAFLTKRWLQSGRIDFPCEFGKKSDTLFLCMECHREHM